MILLANLLGAVGSVLELVLNLVTMLLLARVVISWLSADPYNPIVRFVISSTEPVIAPFRKFSSKIPGPMDWSVLLAFAAIIFLKALLVNSLLDYARALRISSSLGIS